MSKRKKEISLPTIEQVERERNALKKKKEYKKSVRGVFGVLVVVAAVSVLIATLIFPVLQISGDSMVPTLSEGEIVCLVSFGGYDTGDLCSFSWNNKILIKRVIASSGDWVDIDENGTVYVNQKELDEPYLKEKGLGQCDIQFPYQVPDNHYFVLGDNRKTSVDSRNTLIGCVDKEQIVGKVVFRVWPFDKIGLVNN